ncbi:MAG: c-type cytochrome [Gammaproteobacteria bacterium]
MHLQAFKIFFLPGIILSFYLSRPEAESHAPIDTQQSTQTEQEAQKIVEKIYTRYCKTCHAQNPVIPSHAPKLGDQTAWEKRTCEHPNMESAINAMLETVKQGKDLMPAQGGCFECSDELLKKTIVYLLNYTKN